MTTRAHTQGDSLDDIAAARGGAVEYDPTRPSIAATTPSRARVEAGCRTGSCRGGQIAEPHDCRESSTEVYQPSDGLARREPLDTRAPIALHSTKRLVFRIGALHASRVLLSQGHPGPPAERGGRRPPRPAARAGHRLAPRSADPHDARHARPGHLAQLVTDHAYKSVEITGSSPKGVTQAIDGAIAKAAKSLRHLDWFEVITMRGEIEDGRVAHYQVTLKIGFRLDD